MQKDLLFQLGGDGFVLLPLLLQVFLSLSTEIRWAGFRWAA